MASHNMAPSYLCSKYQYTLKLKTKRHKYSVSVLNPKNSSPMVTFIICNI